MPCRDIREVDVQLSSLLTSALGGVGGQHQAPATFPPGEKKTVPVVFSTPDGSGEQKFLFSYGGFEPRIDQPAASCYTDYK